VTPQLLRFINADPLKGTIADGATLNAYAYANGNPISYVDPFGASAELSQAGHIFLDMAGMLPVGGIVFDAINVVWYIVEGDWTNAGWSALALIPGVGYFSQGAKYGIKAISKIDDVYDVAKSAGEATGQLHHILSNKTMKALNEHHTLKGVFEREDAAFKYRAKDADAHKGYQQWHRDVDNTTVDWLQNNPNATPEQFKKFLNDLYQQPGVSSKIPGVNIK